MALSDYEPPRRPVKLPGGKSFSVRGMSVDDLSAMVVNHLADIEKLYMAFQGYRKAVGIDPDLSATILRLARDMPILAARVVAVAADEPENAETVRRLPFPVVVAALREIVTLTWQDYGSPGEWLAALRGLGSAAGTTTTESPEVRTAS